MKVRINTNFKNLRKVYKNLIEKSKHNIVYPLLLFIIIDLLILLIDFIITPPLKIGDIAPKNIEAPRTIIYKDEEETERIKNLLLSQFKPVYTIDQNIILQNISKLSELMIVTEESSNITKYFSSLPSSRINLIKKKIEKWLIENYTKGIKPEETDEVKQKFINFLIDEIYIPAQIAQELSEILIVPNMFINEKETETKKQELLKSIKPIERLITKGEIIVRKSEKITRDKFIILEALGYTLSQKNILRLISLFLTLSALQLSITIFTRKYLIIEKNLNIFLLMNFLFTLSILSSKIFSFYSPYLNPLTSYLFISTVLLDFPLSYIVSLTIIVSSSIFSFSYTIPILLFFDFLIINNKIKELENRSDYVKIGSLISLIRIPFIVFGKLVFNESDLTYTNMIYSFINPTLSAILSVGIIPPIEELFRVATPLKLLEMTNPDHPLLRKLLMEAPGTYYHSLIVGNLAERAAKEAGANERITRTAALYHDIGKVKRPQYFIENLLPGQNNPHENLSPYISALIIKSHPKNGAIILNNYKFPKNIIDIVEQHHGTSLINYFYNKQLQISKKYVPEDDFRYPGPKPESKEAAIVMLADSIEAATRTITNITPETIEKVIREVIREKLIDGQLENSKLTLEELEKIAQSFIKTIIELRHPRIPYPSFKLKEE
uniref:HDIG domain-containing protein n=1 Tax=Dictyoglomus thermophilum TaxID=14 RepID=A0A7C3RN47_DICTH